MTGNQRNNFDTHACHKQPVSTHRINLHLVVYIDLNIYLPTAKPHHVHLLEPTWAYILVSHTIMAADILDWAEL